MADKTLETDLWKPRSVEETRALYSEWAANYDSDLAEAVYRTPARIAEALARFLTDRSTPILDFGCGTGLSGLALTKAGYTVIDGIDITPEMVKKARELGIYRMLDTPAVDADLPGAIGSYGAITATGVISLGAAPPDTLDRLLDHLAPGGYLALSFNDPTLADQRYLDALERVKEARAKLLFCEHGPHLESKSMGSKVYILEKR